MEKLVDELVDMSSLRDRDALDKALVRLVARQLADTATAVGLFRVVGDGDDLRCLPLAKWDDANTTDAKPEPAWSDWAHLPHLERFPLRVASLAQAQVVQSEKTPFLTVFPMVLSLGGSMVLELVTRVPLSEVMLKLIQSVVQNYKNLMGLLDYSEKDALTELLNRKTFDGAFFKATEIQQSENIPGGADRRHTTQVQGYWLAVLDIDHFKRVNDNFGHLIGDEVLLLLARLMRASFRFHDQLYRFGGEEFVVLMRCANADDAEVALERFRVTVQAHEFPQVGTITVSIGFAALRDDDTPGGAFDRADKAVYYAKGNGRNQVCSYQKLVDSGALVEDMPESKDVDFF